MALGGFIKTVVTSVIGWVGSALGGGASLQREKAATEQAKADAKKADAEKAGHVTNQRAIEVLKDELESQRKTKIVPVGEVRATQGEQESPGIKGRIELERHVQNKEGFFHQWESRDIQQEGQDLHVTGRVETRRQNSNGDTEVDIANVDVRLPMVHAEKVLGPALGTVSDSHRPALPPPTYETPPSAVRIVQASPSADVVEFVKEKAPLRPPLHNDGGNTGDA